MKRNLLSQSEIETIREMSFAGKRATEIAKVLGRSNKVISCFQSRNGLPRQPRNKFSDGEQNISWQGGKYVDRDGYVCRLAKNHPFARGKGYVREHRLVVEKILGRYLTETEVVHHKDGNPSNNSPENLQVFSTNGEHLHFELKGRVPKWTAAGRNRILEAVRRKRGRKPSSIH